MRDKLVRMLERFRERETDPRAFAAYMESVKLEEAVVLVHALRLLHEADPELIKSWSETVDDALLAAHAMPST